MDLASNILQSSNMKSPNLRPLCCMPRSKMMKISWILRGKRLQYILVRGLLLKIDDNEMKKESKVDEYIVSLY